MRPALNVEVLEARETPAVCTWINPGDSVSQLGAFDGSNPAFWENGQVPVNDDSVVFLDNTSGCALPAWVSRLDTIVVGTQGYGQRTIRFDAPNFSIGIGALVKDCKFQYTNTISVSGSAIFQNSHIYGFAENAIATFANDLDIKGDVKVTKDITVNGTAMFYDGALLREAGAEQYTLHANNISVMSGATAESQLDLSIAKQYNGNGSLTVKGVIRGADADFFINTGTLKVTGSADSGTPQLNTFSMWADEVLGQNTGTLEVVNGLHVDNAIYVDAVCSGFVITGDVYTHNGTMIYVTGDGTNFLDIKGKLYLDGTTIKTMVNHSEVTNGFVIADAVVGIGANRVTAIQEGTNPNDEREYSFLRSRSTLTGTGWLGDGNMITAQGQTEVTFHWINDQLPGPIPK